ncbi:MAG: DMT family transporter [Granulosicoccus sp.]|nr:DMT family transporter [Granulosicoccus sp.]
MNTRFASIIMLLCVGLLWGLNWPALKFMMAELPVFTIRAIAFPCAALVLVIIALLQGHSLFVVRGQRIPLILTSIFLILGFNMLTSLGQSLTEASTAAIIAYTMPAITAALSAIYLREHLDQRILTAIALGMCGLAVLAYQDFVSLVSSPTGLIVMLLAAISWAIGNVMVKATDWTLHPAAFAAWLFTIATMISWPIVLFLEPIDQLRIPSASVIATMVFHVLGPMVTGYLLWSTLLSRLPATVAALSILTAPVVGVVSAVFFLGDSLTAPKIVSLSLIIMSIIITLKKTAKQE